MHEVIRPERKPEPEPEKLRVIVNWASKIAEDG
jgi:hypothetical protein